MSRSTLSTRYRRRPPGGPSGRILTQPTGCLTSTLACCQAASTTCTFTTMTDTRRSVLLNITRYKDDELDVDLGK